MKELGRGSQGVTHMAADVATEALVAIKELRWTEIEDWKAQELFEREIATLQRLDHPGIPKFVDAFETEESFFLVQEFIEGKNVKMLLDDGHVWNEKTLLRLMFDVLDVLEYLHSHSPPILHRDIKPSNIILRPSEHYQTGNNSDEKGSARFVLVDFGAVQIASSAAEGGSTVIGTPGYMPMEQLQGRATPATDIYGLAATVVHLATREDPTRLDVVRGELQFADRVNLPEHIVATLQACLLPHVEDRLQTATEVRDALRRRTTLKELPAAQPEPVSAAALSAEPALFSSDDADPLDGAMIVNAPEAFTKVLESTQHLDTNQSLARLKELNLVKSTVPSNQIQYVGIPSFSDVPSVFAADVQMAGFVPICSVRIGNSPEVHHYFGDATGTIELRIEGKHFFMTTYFSDGTLVGVTNRNGVYRRDTDSEYFVSRNSIKLDYRDQLGRIARSNKTAITFSNFEGVQQAIALRMSTEMTKASPVMPMIVTLTAIAVIFLTVILFLILM